MYTDVVGSANFKSAFGDISYARTLRRQSEILEAVLRATHDGRLRNNTGDGHLIAFRTPEGAVKAALRLQQAHAIEPWETAPLEVRVGLHMGQFTDMAGALSGLSIDLTARVCSLAQAGQILMTRGVFESARQYVRDSPCPVSPGETAPLRWLAHGPYMFNGLEDAVEVFEVGIQGHSPLSQPQGAEKARRVATQEQESLLGWRPAVEQSVPRRPDWVLVEKLGEGGFGEVWLMRHARTRDVRVIKFCFDAARVRSFKREMKLFTILREQVGTRPDIANILEIQLTTPPYSIETDYAGLGDLPGWAERQGGLSAIPLETRIDIVARMASAVQAAHSAGILHRDIKPANTLMYHGESGQALPRIADFGIGAILNDDRLKEHGISKTGFTEGLTSSSASYFGTRMYEPPECSAGAKFTKQGDIYALGVLLYQMVVADFHRPLAVGWDRDVPNDQLRATISECVQGDPALRFTDAQQLADRLRAQFDLASNLGATTPKPSWRSVPRVLRTTRSRVAAGAAAVAAAVALFAWTTVGSGDSPSSPEPVSATSAAPERAAAALLTLPGGMDSAVPSKATGRPEVLSEQRTYEAKLLNLPTPLYPGANSLVEQARAEASSASRLLEQDDLEASMAAYMRAIGALDQAVLAHTQASDRVQSLRQQIATLRKRSDWCMVEADIQSCLANADAQCDAAGKSISDADFDTATDQLTKVHLALLALNETNRQAIEHLQRESLRADVEAGLAAASRALSGLTSLVKFENLHDSPAYTAPDISETSYAATKCLTMLRKSDMSERSLAASQAQLQSLATDHSGFGPEQQAAASRLRSQLELAAAGIERVHRMLEMELAARVARNDWNTLREFLAIREARPDEGRVQAQFESAVDSRDVAIEKRDEIFLSDAEKRFEHVADIYQSWIKQSLGSRRNAELDRIRTLSEYIAQTYADAFNAGLSEPSALTSAKSARERLVASAVATREAIVELTAIAEMYAQAREDLDDLAALARGDAGYSPAFHAAAATGNLVLLQDLRTLGARIDAPRPADGMTPIHIAAQSGQKAVVEWLLQQRRELHRAQNKDGYRPLALAACSGHAAIVQLLLDHGADVSTKNNRNIPLLFEDAVVRNPTMMLLLIDAAAAQDLDFTRLKGARGRTLLAVVCASGGRGKIDNPNDQLRIAKRLVELGLRPETKDDDGDSAIDLAEKNRASGLADYLRSARK